MTVENIGSTQIVHHDKSSYNKSNALIGAKYKSTLLENKLLALSLSKINEARVGEIDERPELGNCIVSTMTASEIKKTLNLSSKNIYARLEEVSGRMMGRTLGWTDPDKKEFEYFNLVIYAGYKNGKFTIAYNPILKKQLTELGNTKYTNLNLKTMLNFTGTHSFRLYEILKSKCFVLKDKRNYNADTHIYTDITYSVSELKLELGVVDSSEASVRAKLSGRNPDYDKAVSMSKSKGFERWAEFKRSVIDPSVSEINEKTEMEVSYELDKSGRGGKVHSIIFCIKMNDTIVDKEKPAMSQDEKEDIEDNLRDILSIKLKSKEIRSICEVASYDIELIEKAVGILNVTPKVDNVVGFLIKAIKEEWDIPVAKKDSLSNFNEREEDWNEIAKEFIQN